jgi:hypothetical protein
MAGQEVVAMAPGVRAVGRHRRAIGRQLSDRDPRVSAGGYHKKECLEPCSGPTAAALLLLHFPVSAPGPVPLEAIPVRGMGVGAEGRRSTTAGPQGQEALEDQGRTRSACDWCPMVTIRGIRVGHPHDGQPLVGLSAPSPGARPTGPPSPNAKTSPSLRAGIIRDQGQGWGWVLACLLGIVLGTNKRGLASLS